MKGDKGTSIPRPYRSWFALHPKLWANRTVAEFCGTLLGFDDYVSMYYPLLLPSAPMSLFQLSLS
jgi:hypothetical protein